ncbi:MAG: TIGR02808 family protein [Gammaproteobacteria bacterium CG22_combo_CG10-13_8_21_14_all_40_8]|nr:MAG: TIGR02808 family protein [Gammaproteobacteria bacterium CG22_combo_CG10-13_8_21_14_all_40_8]
MSTLESIIWTTLGYLAMPTILIVGFVATAIFSCWALNRFQFSEKSE